MELGIAGKVALVTAASKGLGKAVALQLAKEQANVIICSRNLSTLKKAKAEIESQTQAQVTTIVCDVTKEKQVKRMIKTIVENQGTIDILITNAGGPPAGYFADFAPEDYRKAVELNLMSTISLCYEVVPIMQKQNWGRILMMTSVSVKQPIPNLILSNTARTGVIGFMKSLSNEVAENGITVNSICPGYTKTQRVENLAEAYAKKNDATPQDFYQMLEAKIPMKRIGTTEEFAKTAAFLVSQAAGYITGDSIKVDGGFSKGLF